MQQIMHILPHEDIREHTEEPTCWCNPKLHERAHAGVYIHRPADGREEPEHTDAIIDRLVRMAEIGVAPDLSELELGAEILGDLINSWRDEGYTKCADDLEKALEFLAGSTATPGKGHVVS